MSTRRRPMSGPAADRPSATRARRKSEPAAKPARQPGISVSAQVAAASTRPRTRDRTSAVERDLFAATERLLEVTTARELSVAQMIEEAGISRGTFYHYFSSKWEVINSVAAIAMAEIYERVLQFVQDDAAVSRQEALRRSVAEGCAAWASNRAVLRAIYEHWREVPELRGLQLSLLEPFRVSIAEELERERAAGLAPAGSDASQLVAALLWSSLTCLYVAGLSDVDDIPDETAAAVLLTDLWLRTLYGDPDAR
ncbi:MAG: TetR family transcriptional regulator [Sporichthyaceae bacterium]